MSQYDLHPVIGKKPRLARSHRLNFIFLSRIDLIRPIRWGHTFLQFSILFENPGFVRLPWAKLIPFLLTNRRLVNILLANKYTLEVKDDQKTSCHEIVDCKSLLPRYIYNRRITNKYLAFPPKKRLRTQTVFSAVPIINLPAATSSHSNILTQQPS